MSQILQNVDIAPYTTFRLGGPARYFAIATSSADLPALFKFAADNNVKTFILGGGSNIVVTDEPLEILVIKMEIDGIEIVDPPADGKLKYSLVKAGAGVEWDKLVAWAVKKNLAGIEALSAIPGTCGAAPVQNIGAYGAEFKDVCESVEVYDTKNSSSITLSNKDCKFTYRDSIFKREPGRYVITNIIIKLTPHSAKAPRGHFVKIPDYPGVKDKLPASPTLADIRKAITEIRWNKLPKPSEVANVGSFFKNPIVDKKTFKEMEKKWPNIVNFPAENNKIKIGAGWLIDQCGLKGFTRDSLSTYQNNALVIVNNGQATFDELLAFVQEITRTVNNKFGITLEVEPILVK